MKKQVDKHRRQRVLQSFSVLGFRFVNIIYNTCRSRFPSGRFRHANQSTTPNHAHSYLSNHTTTTTTNPRPPNVSSQTLTPSGRVNPNPKPSKRSNKLPDPHLAPAPLQLTHPVARDRVLLRPARQRHATEEGHHHGRVEARGVVARGARQDAEQVRHLPRERRRRRRRLLLGLL